MLPGKRFTIFRRHRPSYSAIYTHQALSSSSKSSSSHQSKELHSLAVDTDGAFLPWLERKAGTKISSVLSIGKSPMGRFLFASENIRAGNCILKVPFNVQISPDNLPSPIGVRLGDEIGNVAKLALAILLEQKLGQDSEWAPYISRLPQPWEMHNTIFWSESELEMIRKSSLYEESLNQRSQIEKEFLAIRHLLLEHGEAQRVSL